MGSKTCPTCKGTGKVPVKPRPKSMSSDSKMGDRSGPGGRGGRGKGGAGPGGTGGRGGYGGKR